MVLITQGLVVMWVGWGRSFVYAWIGVASLLADQRVRSPGGRLLVE
jgi:hypothetical protein